MRVASVAAALVFLAACAESSSDVFFPTYSDTDGRPLAPVHGTLVDDNGCLWLDETPDDGTTLLLWPETARLVDEDGRLIVRQGGFGATVGLPMRGTGGQYNHEAHYDFVVELIGEEIPERCQATYYWLVFDAHSVESD